MKKTVLLFKIKEIASTQNALFALSKDARILFQYMLFENIMLLSEAEEYDEDLCLFTIAEISAHFKINPIETRAIIKELEMAGLVEPVKKEVE